jgi:hypothetical protein
MLYFEKLVSRLPVSILDIKLKALFERPRPR